MSRERFTGPQMSRRNMLAALGLGDIAAASIPVLGACGLGGRTSAPNGGFGGDRWLRLKEGFRHHHQHLQIPHPYQLSYRPLLTEFTDLTGVNVDVTWFPRPTTSLNSTPSWRPKRTDHDLRPQD